MTKYFSPLRYPGGKSKLARFLAEEIKYQAGDRKIIYVEPFAGGAGAALTLLMTSKVDRIWINDLDPAIYTFWKIAVFDTDRLINKIKKTKVTINTWKRQKLIYKSKNTDDLDLAFATFFLNRTNRSGIIEGGPIGGMNQSGNWKIGARFNKEGLIERLSAIKKYRNVIKVTNKDGIKLIESIQSRVNWNNHFIFIDPPYIEKGQLLYLNHYKKDDHENLARFIKDSKLNWVMTYDDVSDIRKLYPKQIIKAFKIAHIAHTRRIGKEVLISPKRIKSKLEPVY